MLLSAACIDTGNMNSYTDSFRYPGSLSAKPEWVCPNAYVIIITKQSLKLALWTPNSQQLPRAC